MIKYTPKPWHPMETEPRIHGLNWADLMKLCNEGESK